MKARIGVACLDHVLAGVGGGFAQLGHGKRAAVTNLKCGDWVIYYLPSARMGGGDPVQAFTALGRVTSRAAYQAEQEPDFHPWRVDVADNRSSKPALIWPRWTISTSRAAKVLDGPWRCAKVT